MIMGYLNFVQRGSNKVGQFQLETYAGMPDTVEHHDLHLGEPVREILSTRSITRSM